MFTYLYFAFDNVFLKISVKKREKRDLNKKRKKTFITSMAVATSAPASDEWHQCIVSGDISMELQAVRACTQGRVLATPAGNKFPYNSATYPTTT